jgi:putative ABC transport system permease protein
MVKLFPGVSPDAAFIAALDQRLAGQGLRVAGVKTTGETRTSLQSNFTSVLMILIMMALLLALVGGMGLMGAMSINVLERTREIGVLRAIGASHRGVHLVFMLEGVAIGLASSLLSIPLSYPITQFVASAIGSLAASAPWTGSFTATGTLAWLALVTLLSLAANYLPARSAARLTVREVLSYE